MYFPHLACARATTENLGKARASWSYGQQPQRRTGSLIARGLSTKPRSSYLICSSWLSSASFIPSNSLASRMLAPSHDIGTALFTHQPSHTFSERKPYAAFWNSVTSSLFHHQPAFLPKRATSHLAGARSCRLWEVKLVCPLKVFAASCNVSGFK